NRVAARAHGPDDLVDVGRIDVIVDGDDPLGEVRATRHLRRQRQRLRGVAGVALLEAEHGHAEATRRGGVRIHALESWNTELVEIGPDARGAGDGEEAALLA